jgi:hypothetical protein
MGNTNSDELEELLHKAYKLGILNELRDRASTHIGLPTPTPKSMLERYESCFHQIIKERTTE